MIDYRIVILVALALLVRCWVFLLSLRAGSSCVLIFLGSQDRLSLSVTIGVLCDAIRVATWVSSVRPALFPRVVLVGVPRQGNTVNLYSLPLHFGKQLIEQGGIAHIAFHQLHGAASQL